MAEDECAHIADEVMVADQENAYQWDFVTTYFWLLIHGYIKLEEEKPSITFDEEDDE